MPLLSTFGAASVRSFGGIGAVAAGAGLDVDEAFSTYLYDGTGSAQTITNGIDHTAENTLVWTKTRSSNQYGHRLIDEGNSLILSSDVTNGALNGNLSVSQYYLAGQSNGFRLLSAEFNVSGQEYVAWTFRKAPKFFDVVTYTGDGQSSKTISHSLGTTVGMMLVKQLNTSGDWHVFHRSGGSGNGGYLNATDAFGSTSVFPSAPTSTNFSVAVATNAGLNKNNNTYVAYLFAHNNSDGGFGPDSDQDIIKCGSFTSDSSGIATVNLGFEPQWVLFKGVHAGSSWFIVDVMRGMVNGSNDAWLAANLSNAEGTTNTVLTPTPTGFVTDGTNIVDPSSTFIYMAIRRGPLAEPTSGTDVFAIDTQSQSSAPFAISNFPVDFAIRKDVDGSGTDGFTRLLQGTGLFLNTSAAEGSDNVAQFDYNNGYLDNTTQDSTRYNWMWKRAPSYFDVVGFSGDGSSTASNRTAAISHNLGVQPEMIWVKRRDSTSEWVVAHKDYGAGYLNLNNAFVTYSSMSTTHNDNFTATNFKIGAWQQEGNFNVSGATYIAYLFATVAGVSKVGSYTGNGSTQNIDCGFSNGARFVLIKKTSDTGHWVLFDTARGIVAGNDARLKLNSTDAESSSYDDIDPLSSGFTLNNVPLCNYSGASYIFYAIA